eukprot:3933662-Rhodomonas_salina.1
MLQSSAAITDAACSRTLTWRRTLRAVCAALLAIAVSESGHRSRGSASTRSSTPQWCRHARIAAPSIYAPRASERASTGGRETGSQRGREESREAAASPQ